jgi:hypothetical protein
MKSFVFFILLFNYLVVHSQYEHASVIGNVKSMHLKEYDAKIMNGEVVDGKIKIFQNCNYLDEYDEQGLMIKRSYYSIFSDGISSYVLYKYDKYSNLISAREYNLDKELLSFVRYEYDKDNNLIMYEEDAYQHRFHYYSYGVNNELLVKKQMVINKTFGQEIDTNWYNSFYTYNDSLQLIKEERTNNDSPSYRIDFEYDNLGRVSLNKIYEDGITLYSIRQNIYDENGLLVKKLSFSSEMVFQNEIKYTYDEHKNIVRQESLRPNGELIQGIDKKYDYDSQGNWIKLTESWSNTGETWVTYREIEYYH